METVKQPAPVQDPTALAKSNKQKLAWGLICLIAPTALFVVALLLYAVVNFIGAASAPEPTPCPPAGPDSIMMGACAPSAQSDLFPTSPAHTIANVILFIAGAVSTLTWLPGIIVGIVLLASRKRLPTTA